MSSIGGQVSRALSLKGVASTVVDGVTAGLHALVHACELLRQNDSQDAVVVVAADEIGGLFFRLLDRLGVLAETGGRGPGEALCPYDPGATGMVLGEGAAALVLERASSAAGCGAAVLAAVAGYGLAGDGGSAGYPEPEPTGRQLERAIRAALEEAGIGPEGLDVVYGHGRGIPAQDQREAQALGRVLAGRPVPVGCVLGHTGVAEAASGLFSVAAAVLGMGRSEAYPVAGGGGSLAGGLAYVRGGSLAGVVPPRPVGRQHGARQQRGGGPDSPRRGGKLRGPCGSSASVPTSSPWTGSPGSPGGTKRSSSDESWGIRSSRTSGLARGRNQWDVYAQHFAVKESLFKALGTGLAEGMSWRDVQVIVTDHGHDLRISGETGRRLAAAGMTEHWLSLGCAGGLAVAVVVLGGRDHPAWENSLLCEGRSDEDEWRP